jgi:hypothetical protein
MPKFKKTEEIKITDKNQKTLPGLFISGGEIDHSDYDTKSWSELQQNYTNMRNGDPMISTSVDILKYPILRAERMIEQGRNTETARQAVEYIEFCYDNMFKPFSYLKYHKLLALEYGLSLHETIIQNNMKYQGKRTNRIIKMSPIQNETINKFYYDELQNFNGIEHERRQVDYGSEFVDIKLDQLDYFTWNEEFNDIRGKSMLRPIRLAYDAKKRIVEASARSIERGTGIPVIYHQGNPTSSDKTLIEKIGKSLTQLKYPYVAMDETKLRLELLEPRSQKDMMSMLDFLNKEILYNTLTEFMVSGIGQNGSRAATNEHKTAYELSANNVLAQLEENFQRLTNRMIKISHLGNIPKEDYPIFRFASISQTDLQKVATNLKTLAESTIISWSKQDEKYIREQFGLPMEDPVISVQDNETGLQKEKPECGHSDLIYSSLQIEKPRELTHAEKTIFEFQSATNHFETMKERGEAEVQFMMNKIIDDVITQAESSLDKDIELRYFSEFTKRMNSLYDEGFNKGQKDIVKEISKVKPNIKANKMLATNKSLIDKAKKIIKRKVSKLYKDIETTIQNRIDNANKKFINNIGINKYLKGFSLEFKFNRRAILDEVTGAYIDGRANEMTKHPEVVYEYSAILDKNICEICAPEDGTIYTIAEIHDRGLNLEKPVNPECLGWDRCRCLWIPTERSE